MNWNDFKDLPQYALRGKSAVWRIRSRYRTVRDCCEEDMNTQTISTIHKSSQLKCMFSDWQYTELLVLQYSSMLLRQGHSCCAEHMNARTLSKIHKLTQFKCVFRNRKGLRTLTLEIVHWDGSAGLRLISFAGVNNRKATCASSCNVT